MGTAVAHPDTTRRPELVNADVLYPRGGGGPSCTPVITLHSMVLRLKLQMSELLALHVLVAESYMSKPEKSSTVLDTDSY